MAHFRNRPSGRRCARTRGTAPAPRRLLESSGWGPPAFAGCVHAARSQRATRGGHVVVPPHARLASRLCVGSRALDQDTCPDLSARERVRRSRRGCHGGGLPPLGVLPGCSPPHPGLGPARLRRSREQGCSLGNQASSWIRPARSVRSPCRSSWARGKPQRCMRRGEARALCSRPARMRPCAALLLDRQEAFFVPTLDLVRCPPALGGRR